MVQSISVILLGVLVLAVHTLHVPDLQDAFFSPHMTLVFEAFPRSPDVPSLCPASSKLLESLSGCFLASPHLQALNLKF